MIEARGDLLRDRALAHHLRPIEQQVVVIEHALLLLGFDIGRKQHAQFAFPFHAPRKEIFQHFQQRRLGIDRA